jgi:hypothetical protein
MFYMHVQGHGGPADLARKLKPVLDLIGKSNKTAPAAALGGQVPTPSIDDRDYGEPSCLLSPAAGAARP